MAWLQTEAPRPRLARGTTPGRAAAGDRTRGRMLTRHGRGSEFFLGQEHTPCTHLSHQDLMEKSDGRGQKPRVPLQGFGTARSKHAPPGC